MINNICFGAKPIGNLEVLKYNRNLKSYQPHNLNLVKIEPELEGDVVSVCNAARSWKNDNEYAKELSDELRMMHLNFINSRNRDIYAATTQNDGFDKLQSGKILGLIEISRLTPAIKIEYLNIKPEAAYRNKNREYKKIGCAIIEYIKSTFKKKTFLQSDYRATNFYEKLGFKIVDKEKFWYTWAPDKL